MFKSTGRSGLRRASAGGGVSQTSRVSGLHGLRQRDISTDNRRRPAFLPDTPQEQATDSSSSRISEPGESKSGYTGANIGAS